MQCLERKLVPFILKLSGLIRGVFFEYWRKQAYASRTSALEERQESSSSAYGEVVHKADEALSCMERLHRLEMLFEEIKRKPAEIPAEKDQMIQQSMERIKSVEVDLDKTKRVCLIIDSYITLNLDYSTVMFYIFQQVLHTAVVKQFKIAELLKNLKQSSNHVRFYITI